MQVIDRLTPVRTAIGHHTIAPFKPQFLSDVSNDEHEMPKKHLIFIRRRGNVLNFFFGDHQNMGRRLGRNVSKREAMFILVKDLGWDFSSMIRLKMVFSLMRIPKE